MNKINKHNKVLLINSSANHGQPNSEKVTARTLNKPFKRTIFVERFLGYKTVVRLKFILQAHIMRTRLRNTLPSCLFAFLTVTASHFRRMVDQICIAHLSSPNNYTVNSFSVFKKKVIKATALCSAILIILSACVSPSKNELIQGEWKITSRIDSSKNSDYLKTQDAPHYSVRFLKDSVYVMESEDTITNNYTFKWDIFNDSLEVDHIVTFKIEMITKDKCILSYKLGPLFGDETNSQTETLILMKN